MIKKSNESKWKFPVHGPTVGQGTLKFTGGKAAADG